jgi:hypothetical protein
MLYVGTNKPLPRKSWEKESPDLSVESLTEQDAPIRALFKSPEVQYVGSTSGCGCDFPHLMYQNGEWPVEGAASSAERFATDRFHREALFRLLRATDEKVVEIYGEWAGDHATEPRIREEIPLDRILDSDLYFKERGFLRVML